MLTTVKKIFTANIDIPSCTISEAVLEDLSCIIEDVASEALNDEEVKQSPEWLKKSHEPKYEIITEKMRLEGNTLQEIQKEKLSNVQKMHMSIDGLNSKSISIDFNFVRNDDKFYNKIEVSGVDETWVRGTETRLREIINKDKNQNHFLYGWLQYLYIPIIGYFSFAVITSIMEVLLVPVILFFGDFFNIHLPNETIETLRATFGENSIISILNPILASFSFGYLIDFFVIKRIFPFIEFYHEKNLRDSLKASLIAIIGIISAIKLIFDIYVLFAN